MAEDQRQKEMERKPEKEMREKRGHWEYSCRSPRKANCLRLLEQNVIAKSAES